MAKMTRERAVREKREKKQEKKRAAAAERKALAAGGPSPESSTVSSVRHSGRTANCWKARRRTAPRAQMRSSIRISPTEMMVRYWANAWCPACSRYWSASSIRRYT